ncbi:DUF4183 domain-containing protein [Sporolactobacillus sp. CPB3-1]|uniref:DUF4183 domain-containing protein n=1 Tax=Sporolactobacillus mangiferae TaxID=2940498 RepID=A0ABT0M6U7_9BACL|nr:DUF4183 domain-containing protein [Sporolactobacillus mangiferae]MCL1630576.1 DUF4183 domain-containing protein [Sporolactobacillus mangiferae]
MPLKIIKLAFPAETKLSVTPSVGRFFYETKETAPGGTTLQIDVSEFLDDTGENASEFPELNLDNSYFHVFINGVLQMEDNFAYTSGGKDIGNLMMLVPEGSEVASNVPIILEIVNFDPSSKNIAE